MSAHLDSSRPKVLSLWIEVIRNMWESSSTTLENLGGVHVRNTTSIFLSSSCIGLSIGKGCIPLGVTWTLESLTIGLSCGIAVGVAGGGWLLYTPKHTPELCNSSMEI